MSDYDNELTTHDVISTVEREGALRRRDGIHVHTSPDRDGDVRVVVYREQRYRDERGKICAADGIYWDFGAERYVESYRQVNKLGAQFIYGSDIVWQGLVYTQEALDRAVAAIRTAERADGPE